MKIPATIEEKLLLYRVRVNQDEQAFATLYDRYVEAIYRFCFFKLSNKEEAQDITSETFIKVWQYLINTEHLEVQNVKSLIYSIARNNIIDLYRSRSRRPELPLDESIDVVAATDVVETMNQSQDHERMLGLLKKLKQEYQEVVMLRYIEDFSIGDIADILGKTNTTIRVTLHRAVKKLQTLSEL